MRHLLILLFWFPVRRTARWLEVQNNRRRVYNVAKVLLPLLATAGWVTTGQRDTALWALQFLVGFSVPHLAARHTPKG